MKASVAFDVCHEIYAAARELVDSRLPTMQLDSASKFLWRPDRRPRLIEFVADFALAGDRALTEPVKRRACSCPRSISCNASRAGIHADAERDLSRELRRDRAPTECTCRFERSAPSTLRASRLILFRMYYLGGAEYDAARRLLGISELTRADWTDEIRTRVGRELICAGMFPPGRYFRQPTKK
jgi:hypothetical protein